MFLGFKFEYNQRSSVYKDANLPYWSYFYYIVQIISQIFIRTAYFSLFRIITCIADSCSDDVISTIESASDDLGPGSVKKYANMCHNRFFGNH